MLFIIFINTYKYHIIMYNLVVYVITKQLTVYIVRGFELF